MRVVESRIQYWSDDYDRRVLIVKVGNEIVGIDFMQGDEPYDFTSRNGDPTILAVYNAAKPYLSKATEYECVNQAINIWFDLSNEGIDFR